MATGLYRCENDSCDGGNYECDAAPACPKCGAGGHMATELVPVHYLVPAEGPIKTGIGNRMVACDPKMVKLPASATGVRSVVTCPKCLAAVIFAEDERDNVDNHVPVIERKIASEHGVKLDE